MKISINTEIEIKEEGGEIKVIAPFYINLYELGFIQCGKAKEGYKRWCFDKEKNKIWRLKTIFEKEKEEPNE